MGSSYLKVKLKRRLKTLKKRLLKKVKQIMSEYPSAAIGSWQGLTIKEILEKVDLSNIINEDMDKNKEEKLNDPMFNSGSINPESAFLVPNSGPDQSKCLSPMTA